MSIISSWKCFEAVAYLYTFRIEAKRFMRLNLLGEHGTLNIIGIFRYCLITVDVHTYMIVCAYKFLPIDTVLTMHGIC